MPQFNLLIEDPAIQISTTSEPITSVEDVFNPNVVKVVTDARRIRAVLFALADSSYRDPPPA